MTVKLSEIGIALVIIEGQLENSISEERRWKLREQEAAEMRQAARDRIIRWSTVLSEVKGRI